MNLKRPVIVTWDQKQSGAGKHHKDLTRKVGPTQSIGLFPKVEQIASLILKRNRLQKHLVGLTSQSFLFPETATHSSITLNVKSNQKSDTSVNSNTKGSNQRQQTIQKAKLTAVQPLKLNNRRIGARRLKRKKCETL
jgi:hypothetical protein